MNPMRWTGMILLWLGFLSGALATVFRLEIAEDKWATIPWVWFFASIAVGIAGVVVLRRNARLPGKRAGSGTGTQQLEKHLGNLATSLGELQRDHGSQTPRETLAFIDNRLRDDFREFAEGRDAITREFGLSSFAEIMSRFASAERAINRVWSASADGYVDEAARYIEIAQAQVRQGLEVLRRLRESSTPG